MCAAAVFLGPADGGVDGDLGDMDAQRHQFPRHTLGQAGLGLTGHGEGPAQRKTLQRRAGIGEEDAALRTVGVNLVFQHQAGGLPAHKKGAERGVAKGVKGQVGVGLDHALAENAGDPPVDIMHH